MVAPSGDHIGCRASLKTSVTRVIAPPAAGMVQMLPCMSVAIVRPSGEIATDIDVPSRTVTSIDAGLAAGLAAGMAARRGACPPALPKAASARSRRSSRTVARAKAETASDVSVPTPATNNEISAARFMPRILQEVGDGCGSLLTRSYIRKPWEPDRPLNRGHDQIELRALGCTSENEADRMKQRLALLPGLVFH